MTTTQTHKTYVASTMAQALADVKRELGRDAVILHARHIRKGGLLGLGGRRCWEVTAVPHAEQPSRVAGRYIGDPSSLRPGGKTAMAVADDPAPARSQRRMVLDDDMIHSILTGGLEACSERSTGVSPASCMGVPPMRHGLGNDISDSAWASPVVCMDSPVPLATDETPVGLVGETPMPRSEQALDGGSLGSGSAGGTLTLAYARSAIEAATAYSRDAGVSPAQTSADVQNVSSWSVQRGPDVRVTEDVAAAPDVAAPDATVALFTPAVKPWPREFRDFHDHLLRQDVEERVADELMHELALGMTGVDAAAKSDATAIAARLCDLIAARIHTAGSAPRSPSRTGPRVIALAGPTGVGKTTTIAKLAADFKLRQRQRVGLVTMDTYRIAAVDQLRVYAEIIEVPLRTVLSAGEMHQAVYGMDADVVLIDSAGRSQNDQPRLNELRACLAAASADEVYLVVSATASRRTLLTTLHRFSAMAPTRIILTKLDEAETFGTILSFASAGAPPLAFTTMGQDVPDDIEPADPWNLAQRVLRGAGDRL